MRTITIRALAVAALLLCAAAACKRDAGKIEILVDDRGIPHIFAGSDEDAFFAAGYQVACDRLYQMEMLRRFALGRLSEVMGDDGLERDIQARTFSFARWGKEDMAATRAADPERARLVSAWVAGINRRVGEVRAGTAPLPFGYRPGERDFTPEPWDEADPYVILKGAGFANDKTVEFEAAVNMLFMLYGDTFSHVQILKPAHPFFGVPPEDRPSVSGIVRPAPGPAAPRLPPLTGEEARRKVDEFTRFFAGSPGPMSSNNWAVDGRFTASGRPIIAGDPHLSFGFFGSPYPMHINSKDRGGTYNVAGFAYPGTPGIVLGFNDKVIWTVTTNMGDVSDIWRVVKKDGKAKIGDEWKEIVTRTEEVIVRGPGKPAGEGRIEKVTYEEVPGHGVIVLGDLLMSWTGFTARPARWFMELNRVSSVDDLEATVDRMREMSYNVVAVDSSSMAYRVGLELPKRGGVAGARAPWKAMDGNDAGSFWTGEMLGREQVPHGRAAQRGWLATANTDPWGFTADGAVDNDPWYYGAFFDAGYRGQRIEEELTRLTLRGGITVEDMQALQMDVHSRLSDDILPLLAAAHAKAATDESLARFRGDPDLDRVVALLTQEWDRRMARDSAGALAWQLTMHYMTRGVLEQNIEALYDVAVGLMTVFVVKVAAMTLLGEYPEGDMILRDSRDAILLQAAADAAAWIKGRYGSVDPAGYAYGDMKYTSFDEAYGMGLPVFQKPADGGEDTVCVSTNITFDEGADRWVSNFVSVERLVGTWAADGTPEVYVSYPVGPAADPASADTLAANDEYLNGRYGKLLFTRADIEAALRERKELSRK